jgi:glycosyltransferase involved in cell wall biosynthesis
MKISHISTTHAGGAGIAARNLNSELTARGVDSKFLALKQVDFLSGASEISLPRNFSERLRSGIYGNLQNRLSAKSFFSLVSYSPASISHRISVESKSRILHIHNWYNITNLSQIAELIRSGSKVVMTLHDERTYTGGCHSTLGCNKFQTDCGSCPGLSGVFRSFPRRNLAMAESKYEKLFSEATFIAPSQWILNQAKASRLLRSSRIEFIPNVIKPPKQDVSPYDETKGIRLGFAAMDPNSYIKGGGFFTRATEYSHRNPNEIKVVKMNEFKVDINAFWGAIDFLCVPSNADNSPNVIHEAKLLGIPVLATRVGGIPELLNSDFDIVLDSPDVEIGTLFNEMKKSILRLENPKNRALSISAFLRLVETASDRHIDLYKDVLEPH